VNITVEFLSMPVVTKVIGQSSVVMDFKGSTIEDLILAICRQYGEKVRQFLLDESGKLDMIFKIILNKKEWIYREQMNKELQSGDRITIMMLAAGG
jgi:molybdopterin converting factor small subunit